MTDEEITPALSRAETRALDALLDLAEESDRSTVSTRQLAGRLGCQVATAKWHRDRLVRKGFVRLIARGPREAPEVRATRQRRPDGGERPGRPAA